MLQFSSAPVRPSLVMPVLAAIVAIAIFVVDTVTPLDIAIAVLYVAVVLLAMDFAGPARHPDRRRRLRGADGAELRHHPRPRSGERTVPARPDQPGGDRHHRRCSPRATRARSKRCASTQACSTSRTTRSSCATTTTSSPTGTARRPSSTAGGASRRSAARHAELLQTEFPAPFDGDHGRARAHRTLGGRAGAHHARRPARRRWPAAGRCSATAAAGRRRSWRPTTTSPSAAHGRGRPAPRPQRACPCGARRHPGRAHGLDRP